MEIKFNRAAYLNKKCTHDQYWAQFGKHVVSIVKHAIGEDRIKKSKDKYFNDIPLREWDRLERMVRTIIGREIARSNSSTYANGALCISLSDCVCTAKAAAAIIAGRIDENGNPIE